MRIIIVIDSPSLGGAQRVAFNLSTWLNKQVNITSCIVALNNTTNESYSVDDTDYECIYGYKIIRRLRNIVVNRKADVVVTMGTPLCVYTFWALYGLNIKHIISERNSPANFSGKWITKVISRFLMRYADGFIFQTRKAQNYYGDNIINRSVVIPNPLLDILYIPVHSRDSKIVSVGRLVKQKDHELLIRSFSEIEKKFPDYCLEIYGEGKERTQLMALVNSLGLENKVFFPGESKDIHNLIRSAAVFVLSSKFEGVPNALMEAMALGLPCISTDCPCGGPAELICNGENGLLVPVGDKNAMVKAIEKILSSSKEAELMGKAATKIIETHSMDRVCQKWLDYIKMIAYKDI